MISRCTCRLRRFFTRARSRLKKIKCLQAAPDAKCEACSQAKVSCRFRDRERYFVERSRVMASPSPRPPCGDHTNCKSVHKLQQQPGAPHDELFMPMDGPAFNDFMTPSNTSGSYLGGSYLPLCDRLLNNLVRSLPQSVLSFGSHSLSRKS